MKTHIDPICGMQVNENAPYRYGQDTETVYFCSKRCLDTYKSKMELVPDINEKPQTYFPLFLILGYLVITTGLLEAFSTPPQFLNWMHNFMGGFFIVFSFFKLLDLPGFVSAFRGYDILARKVPAYGYAYPFVELLLGLGFVLRWNLTVLNFITLIFMAISTVGVIQSLLRKNKIQCACLGTVFNLPMSKITLVEDLLMVGMAILGLLFY